MFTKKIIKGILQKHGMEDFKWINPQDIVVSQWVRMKCMYGCKDYGNTATCPPNVPTVAECERFFKEYKYVAVIHFEKKVDDPEDRFPWTRQISQKLLAVEKEIFTLGYERVFLLPMDSCNICKSCVEIKKDCKEPRLARPTPEALAMDVYSTVRKIDYPIQVLSDYDKKMNRYAFLLVE